MDYPRLMKTLLIALALTLALLPVTAGGGTNPDGTVRWYRVSVPVAADTVYQDVHVGVGD
jgi:hypothetical protein